MATISGSQTSYVATLPQKRVVSDRIIMTDPMEIPLIAALGLNNESKFSFVNTPGKLYEWLLDTYAPVSDVAGSTSLTSDSTTTVITMTTPAKFQVGDVLQVDLEYVWVSAVGATTITVTRNFGGTQATHATNATFYIRYSARLENAAANDSPSTEPTSGYNYSVIMQKTINISRTNQLLQRYGIADLVDREIDKAMDEKKMQLTRLPYYGVRAVGTASAARSAGGLDTFITANVTTVGATTALTQKHIEDAVVACWSAGGNPSLLVCNSWPKRKLADIYGGYVETTRDERMGGVEINRLLTSLGLVLNVMVDRHCPADKLYILDPRYVGYITLDEFFYEDLGKVGDSAPGGYGQVVGEYGFVTAYDAAHAIIKTFSTTL